jgi:hypothetical protein
MVFEERDVSLLYTTELSNSYIYMRAWGSVVIKALRANSRTVPRSIPGGVTGDVFRDTPDRTMCHEVDSASGSEYQGFLLGVKAAGAFG